jgi:hypothetical protein
LRQLGRRRGWLGRCVWLLLLLLLSFNARRVQRTARKRGVGSTRCSHPASHDAIRICHAVCPKRDLGISRHGRRTHGLAASGRRSFTRSWYRGGALAIVLRIRSIGGLGCNLGSGKVCLRGHGVVSVAYGALLHGAQTGLEIALGALAWAVS